MAATLEDLVATSTALRSTRSRLDKRAQLQALFARLDRDELCLAAIYLSGEVPQGRVQVGWRALRTALGSADGTDAMPLFASAPQAAPRRSPTLHDLDQTFAKLHALHGPGSAQRRLGVLRQLLEPLDDAQRRFVRGLFLGELRHGALRALVLEALADTLCVDIDALRRAVMFAGELRDVIVSLTRVPSPVGSDVEAVARARSAALTVFAPRHGTPIEPMLATSAEDVGAALADFGGAVAAEWKLDGVRVQVHRKGDDVRVFSRRLRDVSALVPETVELARALSARSFILDGEAIGLDAGDRPVAFQDLMSRFSRDKDATRGASARQSNTPARQDEIARVVTWFFDLLELDGRSRVDDSYAMRRRALEDLVPVAHRVPQQIVDTVAAVERVLHAARGAGHEGVMLKMLGAPYTAGRRGSAWRKVKPAETLDLVILAAEWGSGRRKGFLSNLHLGARDADDPERFHMLGKTFKGLTDVMLREMTADLQAIATRHEEHVVFVRPVRVVEIAFDAVQRSRRYESGFALRFARVKCLRPDKSARQSNTFDEVRNIFEVQRRGSRA